MPEREPSSYDLQHRPTQKHHEGNLGCAVGHKTPIAGALGRGVSSINADSMAIIFKSKITFSPGAVFCFRTISCLANVEETLHHIATPPEKKSSLGTPKGAAAKSRTTPPLTARRGVVPHEARLGIPQRVEG
jgi:hypothetical protein